MNQICKHSKKLANAVVIVSKVIDIWCNLFRVQEVMDCGDLDIPVIRNLEKFPCP